MDALEHFVIFGISSLMFSSISFTVSTTETLLRTNELKMYFYGSLKKTCQQGKVKITPASYILHTFYLKKNQTREWKITSQLIKHLRGDLSFQHFWSFVYAAYFYTG